jgi:DNA-binding XRE family transcriptional regulator
MRLENIPRCVYAADTMTGEELRRARHRLKMSQAKLGEAIELHRNTIARMERSELPIVKTTEFAVKFLLVMKSKKTEDK